ncbi:RNA polymerase sigma factor [Paenibacillus sinopodophylli]|uniref:RNA polymerase sigma factor n=1 Tax=Paenibacillus sinopodophylli TaxID=1837342 RepID=UPI001FE3C415|nr:RNA polymerase sigma factor [Paenibacillus sinopodophylli]
MDFTYLNTLAGEYDREQVLHDLIHVYRNEVWDYAFSITRSVDMADDVVQDVFLKVYEKMHTYRGEASMKTWLLRITRNTSLNRRKSSFFRRVLLMDEVSEGRGRSPSAENQAIDKMVSSEAWKLVLQLPMRHREVMVLHAYHGLAQEEIASLLHVPIGTVKSRLHHARQKLAKRFAGGARDDRL